MHRAPGSRTLAPGANRRSEYSAPVLDVFASLSECHWSPMRLPYAFRVILVTLLLPLLFTALLARQGTAGVTASILLVTNSADSGPGSFRDALNQSNQLAGHQQIHFAIDGAGPHVITPVDPLPDVVDPVSIDGYTQPGAVVNTDPNAVTASLKVQISGTNINEGSGLTLLAGDCDIRGLCITGFTFGQGILITEGGNNVIRGCFLGMNPDGGQPSTSTNTTGVVIDSSSGNRIGGTLPEDRNLISGQKGAFGEPGYGVVVAGFSSAGNVIEGNLIGPTRTGANSILNDQIGIFISNAPETRIGGTQPGSRNLISGNDDTGIRIEGPGATDTLVQGNFIGTDVTGAYPVPNFGHGIHMLDGASRTVVGGATAEARNVISGNADWGVYIESFESQSDSTVIQGNYIGTDSEGAEAALNGQGGVFVLDSPYTQIGGPYPGEGNTISGNGAILGAGIHLEGTGTVSTYIQGNRIGTDATGTQPLGNVGEGIRINSASDTQVGATSIPPTSALGRQSSYTPGNIIGANGAGIIIYALAGGTPFNNRIEGNFIGTDATGSLNLGNGTVGIEIRNGESNPVGGVLPGAGNTIAFNGEAGVAISQSSRFNPILGNRFYANGSIGIDLSLGQLLQNGPTANDPGDIDNGPNDLQNFPVLTGVQKGTSTVIDGTLDSKPLETFRIEFFSSDTLDPSGFGEGQRYLGATNVTTDSSGMAIFSTSLPVQLGSTEVVTATATDSLRNTSEFSGPPGVADTTPPVIVDCSVTPLQLPRAGGSVTVRATVTDNQKVQDVVVYFLPGSVGTGARAPGIRRSISAASAINTTLQPIGGDVYEGAVVLPPNGTQADQVYEVLLIASDVAGNPDSEYCDPVTVSGSADTTPPFVSECGFNPTQLPQAGGKIDLYVVATDDTAVAVVRARIARPNGTNTVFDLVAGANNRFTGSFTAPGNFSGSPQQYGIYFEALDAGGNLRDVTCGFATVAADQTAPAFIRCDLSPSVLSSQGGTVAVTAEVTDDVAVFQVVGSVRRPDNSTADFALVRQPDGTFRGTFLAPANTATADQTYTVTLKARDTSNNAAEQLCGSFVVALQDLLAPALSAPQVSPRALPNAGGEVAVAVTATDNIGVERVTVVLVRIGEAPVTAELAPQGGGSYTGTVILPPNTTTRDRIYGVAFSAVDATGNRTTLEAGAVTVQATDREAPQIANCRVSPRTLQPAGGEVTLEATVRDNVAVQSVVATVTLPDGSEISVPLQRTTGDAFAASFTATENRTNAPEVYQIRLTATDPSGNTRHVDCGRATVGPRRPGRLRLSSSGIEFGRVERGEIATKRLVLRNDGSDTQIVGSIQLLLPPFQVFIDEGGKLKAIAAQGKTGEPVSVPLNLGPGESLALVIEFAPEHLGRYRQLLQIETNDPIRPRIRVRVSGHACRLVRRR